MRKAVSLIAVGSALGSIFVGCGTSGGDNGFANPVAVGDGGKPATVCAGEKLPCTCTNLPLQLDGGKPVGFQCKSDGSFGPCECAAPPPRCGDGVCQFEIGEDCNTCKGDCGECPKCAEAPGCERAKTPPATFVSLPALNTRFRPVDVSRQGQNLLAQLRDEGAPSFRAVVGALLTDASPSEAPVVAELRRILAAEPALATVMRDALRRAGLSDARRYLAAFPPIRPPARQAADVDVTPCGEPKLRIRLHNLKVLDPESEPFIGSDGDKVYCILTSESNNGSEIRITPITPRLDSGEAYAYALYEGVFWGQDLQPQGAANDAGGGAITYEVPRPPRGDLILTYRCWSQHNDSTWSSILTAAGNASAQVAGVAGQYGWAFGLGSVVANVAAAAIAAAQQDVATVYNASQTIGEAQQIPMTNGVSWTVTGGKSGASYEMTMQAWGCATNGGGRRDGGF